MVLPRTWVITKSAARADNAMMVALGLALMWCGIALASQHIRLAMSCDMQLVSTTEFFGLAPARQVLCGCSAPDEVTNWLSVFFKMKSGSSALG